MSPVTEPTAPLPGETLHPSAPVPPPQWEKNKLAENPIDSDHFESCLYHLKWRNLNWRIIYIITVLHFQLFCFVLFFFSTGQLMWEREKKMITSKSNHLHFDYLLKKKSLLNWICLWRKHTFKLNLSLLCGRLDSNISLCHFKLNNGDLENGEGLTTMLTLKEKKRKDSSCVFSVLEMVAFMFCSSLLQLVKSHPS